MRALCAFFCLLLLTWWCVCVRFDSRHALQRWRRKDEKMSSLKDNLQVLRQAGGDPDPKGNWTLRIERVGSDPERTVGLELCRGSSSDVLWSWTKVLDSNRDDGLQTLQLLEETLLELDEVLGEFKSRIIRISAESMYVHQRNTSFFLEEIVKRSQGVQSLPQRDREFVGSVCETLKGVDVFRVETTRRFSGT